MNRTFIEQLVFLLLLTGLIAAQNGSINGKVSDAGSGDPLTGVNIVVEQITGTTTSETGSYTLGIAPGSYTITYDIIGYATEKRSITVLPGAAQTLNIRMTASVIEMGTMIVSASKFEQKLEDVTVSVEVIRPAQLKNRHAQSVSEVLQQTPGVVLVDDEPQIRSGSGYSFGAGSRVLLLVDDMPLLSGDAGRASWGQLPVENVNQIEVVKGAASALYGSSALSGVIHFRTALPGIEPETKVVISGGAYSNPKTAGAKYWDSTPVFSNAYFLHSRIIGNFDLVAGGYFLDDDGFLGPPLNSSDRGASSRYGRANIKLRYRPPAAPGLNIGVNANVQRGRSYNSFIWTDSDSGLYRPYPESTTRTDQTALTTDLIINHLSQSNVQQSLKSRIYFQENDNTNNQSNTSRVFYSEYQLQHRLNLFPALQNLRYTLGVVAKTTSGDADLFAANEDSSGRNSSGNFAAFLQLNKGFADRLNIDAGVRYEYYTLNEETDAQAIFRSGINFRLLENTYLRGSYGQGFRIPTIGEKYIRSIVGGLPIYPSQDLDSEKSWNVEAGLRQRFRISRFIGFLDAAWFYQRYEDFIEFTFGRWGGFGDPLFGLGFRSLNTGDARVRGLDLSLSGGGRIGKMEFMLQSGYTYSNPVALSPELEFGPGVSYLNTSSDTSNHILKYRMAHQARADLQLTYHRFSIGGSIRYNSYMQNIDNVFLDLDQSGALPTGLSNWREEHDSGDIVLDPRMGYAITKNHQVSLSIKNLLNREYALRPLKLEENRSFSLQYSGTFR